MKALRNGKALPISVHDAKAIWMDAIQEVQAKRKDEIMNAAAEAAVAGGHAAVANVLGGAANGKAMLSLIHGHAVNTVKGVEDKGKSETYR